ncbi:hypothetical protein N7471_010307 [Penicillium samsonianum]|uniref:uncharacterized protein n=1 Tax=Penicillium samsonianum TaxID=1882272 RepID=UPI0025468B9B|nr:uncharacterized protein N7471_010307 [Penicillium samsonianum]KAJ6125814.1 hypothetical protein N7471_010307 [Penicillium samsonianum]
MKLHDITSCGDGRYLGFTPHGSSHQLYWKFKKCPGFKAWHANQWRSEPENTGAGEIMSVTVWPRRGNSTFFNVPELLSPSVFDKGRLCLGYEKIGFGPWWLVVRQISDWDLVAQHSILATIDQAYVLGLDSDLVVQYSTESFKIRIWNPRLNKFWEVQHSNATLFNRPHILNGQNGFITTSKQDKSGDVHVLSWRSINWRDTEKPSYIEHRDFTLPSSYFFPEIPSNGEISRGLSPGLFTTIDEIGHNCISFLLQSDPPLAVTYIGEPMEFGNLEIVVGEFSDNTHVIRNSGRCDDSVVKMMKDGKQIWRLDEGRDCLGAFVYLDAYLVIVDRDHRGRLHSRVAFRNINGELVYDFELPWNYTRREIRILREDGRIVIFADDLLEATVWTFFKNTASSTERAGKGEKRYDLRPHKKRRLVF